jgi:hypothetical protein
MAYVRHKRLPYDKLATPYRVTQLRASMPLQVFTVTESLDDYQFDPNHVEMMLLTQSDTMAAWSGRSADGFKTWLNLVVFDEYRGTARRKYFFCGDEQAVIVPPSWRYALTRPRRGVLFNAQVVIDPAVLTTPYATEEARQIAAVRWLAEQLQSDIRTVTGGSDRSDMANEGIAIAGMMMNQVFEGAIGQLTKTPAMARNLRNAKGVEFPHISMNTGRIQMLVDGDTATVRIRVNLPMMPLQQP